MLDLGELDVLPALMGMMLSRQLLPPMMEPKIHATKDALIAGARNMKESIGSLLHSIQYTIGPAVRFDHNVFVGILRAWMQSQRLKIKMVGQEGQDGRVIEPHAFFFWDGAWHLRVKVIDREPQKSRIEWLWESIPLHRIATAEMLEQSFERDPDIKRKMAEEKFFDFRTFKNITLCCKPCFPEAMMRIRERDWFPGQTCFMSPSGFMVLLVPEAAEPVIVPWILQFGGRVRVEAPAELCTLIQEAGRRILGMDENIQ